MDHILLKLFIGIAAAYIALIGLSFVGDIVKARHSAAWDRMLNLDLKLYKEVDKVINRRALSAAERNALVECMREMDNIRAANREQSARYSRGLSALRSFFEGYSIHLDHLKGPTSNWNLHRMINKLEKVHSVRVLFFLKKCFLSWQSIPDQFQHFSMEISELEPNQDIDLGPHERRSFTS
ncbi:hypothetical protein FB451DRAFT_1245972 [Mycena latifolia]|nr:hypothetical protein FB451DRAFT_1245972 [Mycena latifolia]